MKNINELDAKTILEDEIFFEIYEEKDIIQQSRLILTLTDRAKELGVKQNFDRMLKAFAKSKRNYTQKTGGNYTEFDGEYPQLYSGGWTAGEDGITILTNFGEKTACSHPILPVKSLINAETGYVKTVLAFKVRNRWKEIIVDKEVMSSSNRITGLSKYGVRVTSENARALVQYLADIESMNDSLIPEQLSTSKLGWLNKGFVPYDDSVIFDNDDNLSGAFKSIQSCGSYTKWLDLMHKIRKSDRLEPKIYLAGAFASPLLHKFNALPFIVSTYGKTGKGKTVALMVATSVWADPTEGKYWIKAKANEIALEVRLDFLNHLPLAIDDFSEIQKKLKDDFSGYVYSLCSGGGKERSNVNIGLQRQRYWKNIILTNSERSLISETMQGGAINRIIEFESDEGNIFGNLSESVEVVNTVKEHYGYAGREFIEIISDMNLQEIRNIQKEFQDRIYSKAFELGIEKEDKQILPMSILLTADKIATDHIFEDGMYLDFDICFDILKNKDEVSEEERAYTFIMSDVAIHRNNFVPDDYGNYRGEIWGCIDNGYVVIHNNIFKGMCERGNFSGKSFLTWADRNDLLLKDKDKDSRVTKNKKFNGKSIRCIFLKMDDSEESEDDEIIENTEFVPIDDQMDLPFNV
nr:DUF927 domain-containing protein [uncultured Anaerocolumna sp.]